MGKKLHDPRSSLWLTYYAFRGKIVASKRECTAWQEASQSATNPPAQLTAFPFGERKRAVKSRRTEPWC